MEIEPAVVVADVTVTAPTSRTKVLPAELEVRLTVSVSISPVPVAPMALAAVKDTLCAVISAPASMEDSRIEPAAFRETVCPGAAMDSTRMSPAPVARLTFPPVALTLTAVN